MSVSHPRVQMFAMTSGEVAGRDPARPDRVAQRARGLPAGTDLAEHIEPGSRHRRHRHEPFSAVHRPVPMKAACGPGDVFGVRRGCSGTRAENLGPRPDVSPEAV